MTPMPTASPMRQVVNRITSWAVDGVYLLTVVCVLALAVRVVASIVRILWHAPSYAAILAVLDPLLFLLMLAELLHTIALALQTHHLPLRPLLALVLMAVLGTAWCWPQRVRSIHGMPAPHCSASSL